MKTLSHSNLNITMTFFILKMELKIITFGGYTVKIKTREFQNEGIKLEKEKIILVLKEKFLKNKLELIELNEFLYKNPEIGGSEYKAKKKHLELLLSKGFSEEKIDVEIETAYKVKYSGKKQGPVISYMAEYDALPEIGHGCGHNILGAASIGAALLLKDYVDIYGGEVIVLGTPAEENFGGKVEMVKAGIFNNIDVAIISHPTSEGHYRSGISQAMEALEFKFKGKTAHAAGDPHNGINALDAVVNFYVAVNSIKHQVKQGACIHGIISNGGTAANIVPDLAVANFYVRAEEISYVKELVEKIKNCGNGIATATGTTVEISNYEATFSNLVTNEKLMELYEKNLNLIGVKEIFLPDPKGSTDAGDVSQICPTIHPYFPISEKLITGHSIELANATVAKEAYIGFEESVISMAMTGIDLLSNNSFLEEIKEEFKNKMK